MAEITRIIYDVAEAIANLKKLDRQTGKTGRKTKKDFKDGGAELKKFGDIAGKINPKVGNLTKGVGSLTSTMGPLALGVTAVGTAVVGVIAQIVDFQEVLRDSRREAEEFIRTGNRARDLENLAADIESSRTFSQLEGKSLQARAERSRITQTQIQVAAEIESSRLRIKSATDSYRAIEKALKESVKRRKAILKELGDDSAKRAIDEETTGQTGGRAVLNLASRAEEEALKGNTKLAKELTDEARDRAAELGNHVLFTRAIAGAEETIKGKLKEQAKEEENLQKKLQRRLALVGQIRDREEGRLEGFTQRQNDLTRRKANLESVENDINRAKELDTASTKATQAANNWTQALDNSRQIIETLLRPDARTQAGIATDRIKALAPGGKTQLDVLEENRAVTRATQRLQRLEARLEQDPTSAQAVTQDLAQLFRDIGNLRRESPGGALSPTAEARAKSLEAAATELEAAAKAQKDATAAGKGITGTPEEIRDAVSKGAAEGFERALGRRIGRTEIPDISRQQQQPTPGLNEGAASPTTLNVEINGGMLDEATMQQIETRFRRLIREEKSGGIA